MPMFAGRVADWVLITGATASTGLMFLLYPLTSSALAMGICSAALGMVLGTVTPLVMTVLHQVTPPHRHGEALAIRHMMVNASSVGMPLIFGLIGGVAGANGVFWAMGVILGCGSRLGVGLRGMGEDQDAAGR